MKTLAILLSLGSFNAFAMNLYTNCDVINLQKDYESVNVYLSKEGELQDGNLEISVTEEKSGEKIEIDGFRAQVVNATLLDSTTRGHWGLGGHSTTSTKVYGVKFHLSADESIGHEINGCIPQPIKQLDTYAICYERQTIMNRE